MDKQITLASSEDIALVTLQNDARANAIDKVFCDELLTVLDEIEASKRYRAVILRAKGPIFSAGGDLNRARVCRDVLGELPIHDVGLGRENRAATVVSGFLVRRRSPEAD